MITSLMTALVLLFAGMQDTPQVYEAGQVWEYRTRPQEPGSRVIIREVQDHPQLGRVYHISLLGLNVAGGRMTTLQHAPVSQTTLDASVTTLSDDRPSLPDYRSGMAVWEDDEGGVYDIPLAEIVAIIELKLTGS